MIYRNVFSMIDLETQTKTIIVIPTYNETENIAGVVARIEELYPGMRIFIVDDNSPDGTGAVANTLAQKYRGVSVLHRKEKTGIGPAYRDAFVRVCLEENVTYVITMDADFSHDPDDIEKFFTHAGAGDLVIGSRYVHGGRTEDWSLWRRCLSRWGNRYARVVTGTPIRDMTAGFVLYRRELLEQIMQRGITGNGYAFQIEMKYVAHTLGATMEEVPITFKERKQGVSKLERNIITEGIVIPLRLRFGRLK